jgi:hypothetical protein
MSSLNVSLQFSNPGAVPSDRGFLCILEPT